jgi:hypothetical protein
VPAIPQFVLWILVVSGTLGVLISTVLYRAWIGLIEAWFASPWWAELRERSPALIGLYERLSRGLFARVWNFVVGVAMLGAGITALVARAGG